MSETRDEIVTRVPYSTRQSQRGNMYLLLPLPSGSSLFAGDVVSFDPFVVGKSSGEIVRERDLEAKSLFLNTSEEGGSSEDLVGKVWPIRPLRDEELVASPLGRGGRNTGTAVRGVSGDVGGRARGTELME